MSNLSLVGFFFKLQHTVKLFHWQTTDYAAHMASDMLHTGLAPLVDQFIEVYQGNKKIRVPDRSINLDIQSLSKDEFSKLLKEATIWFNNEIFKFDITAQDTELLNIRDEIVGLINKTIYLLTLN